jgi:hypothetical protein
MVFGVARRLDREDVVVLVFEVAGLAHLGRAREALATQQHRPGVAGSGCASSWAVAGLAWGAAVWALMNLLVLPLSRVPQAPLTALSVIHGFAGHALFVGLAAAIVARRVLGGERDAQPR